MITLRRLTAVALVPLLATLLLHFYMRGERFKNVSDLRKQIYVGIIFGLIAIFATEFGVLHDYVNINVRDSAPLCAGLFFGPIAGIIAGLIGGIERWICVIWNDAYYTRLACSIATVLTGFIAAYLRDRIFENKTPQWTLALFTGIFCETVHMILIFVTNLSGVKYAFDYVRACSVPMILVNSVVVGLAAFFIQRIERDTKQINVIPTISTQYQNSLIVVVFIGFIFTSFFVYFLQRQISINDTFDLMALNTYDAYADLLDQVNDRMYQVTTEIAEDYYFDLKGTDLKWLSWYYGVKNIMIVDKDGIITESSDESFLGKNLKENQYAKEFLANTNAEGRMVSYIEDNQRNLDMSLQFAAIKYNGNYVITSYDEEMVREAFAERVDSITENRRVGEWGFLVVVDSNGNIVSETGNLKGQNVNDLGLIVKDDEFDYRKRHTYLLEGTKYYYMLGVDGYYDILAFIPTSEADFSKLVSTYLNIFMLTVAFGLLFVGIYYVTKHIIVNNINKVNGSMKKITDGNLDTVVDVKTNQEFISLSDGINMTVDSLKKFIKEANERIDNELKYAKAIQSSALPSDFPAFPGHDEFDLFALMDPAREVGGDFYDFYMLNDYTIVFLVADVSGKGIPASLFMMRSKTMIRNYAESGVSTGEIFTKANKELCEGNSAGMFVTAWIGILDLKTGDLRFANAGHNPPLLRRKDGKFEYLKMPAGLVLAGMDSIKYKEQNLKLEPGDEIFLYTDGVVEATNLDTQLYGEDRLLECLNSNIGESAMEVCTCVKKDVDDFYKGAEQFDDITELSFQFKKYAK